MQRRGIAYAIISSSTFGLIPLFSVAAMRGGQTPYSVLFYRFLISAILFGIFAKIKQTTFRVSAKQLVELVVLGVGCYGCTALFLILSYQYIPTGIVTTINFLYPVMVAIIMLSIFKEKPTVGIVLAIILSLAGVALMAWSDGATLSLRGIGYSVITVFCYGFYIVGLQKSSLRHLNGSTVTFYVLLIATLFFGAVALLHGGVQPITSVSVGVNLLLLAIVATIISNFTLILAVKEIGSTAASVLGSSEPLTALLVGIFWFSETITFTQSVGIILVLVSVFMVILLGKRTTRRRR